ncbi:hypothetical protein A8F03_20225, partial [Burkholderia cenocepacia]
MRGPPRCGMPTARPASSRVSATIVTALPRRLPAARVDRASSPLHPSERAVPMMPPMRVVRRLAVCAAVAAAFPYAPLV